MPGVIKSRVYIPEEDFNPDLFPRFEVEIFDEAACKRCPYREGKPNDYCQTCQAYQGTIKLWKKARVQGRNYIAIPSANLKRISKITGIDFSDYTDLRVEPPFEYPLKWTGHLREGEIVNDVKSANQKEIAEKWLDPSRRWGFIQAPPRTGKSVLAVNIACTLGLKTIFIAHQNELLENFYKSWLRDTNLEELRKETGKPIVGIINKKKDFEGLDVALVTYQKFIRTASQEDIKTYIKGKFGLAIVDEAHQSGAIAYSKFMSELDCRYKLGMSATPMRKDVMNQVLLNVIGPVTVKSEAVGLIPRIELLETGVKVQSAMNWTITLNRLWENKDRNKLILKEVAKDLKEHKCILIPVQTIRHLTCLVESINNTFGYEIAVGYHSKTPNRKNLFKEIDDGKYRVVVAIMSMIKQGIDLLSPSMIYFQIPMSANKTAGAPMAYQMGNRVCTPYPGKREPVIKVFIDNIKESIGCFQSLFLKEFFPGLKAPVGGRPRYKMNQAASNYAFQIIKEIRKKEYDQAGPWNPESGKERPQTKKKQGDLFLGW